MQGRSTSVMLEGSLKNLRVGPGGTETVRRQCIGACETVTISGTTAKTAALLPVGAYYVSSNVACYVRQGPYSTIAATVAAGHPLPAGVEWVMRVTMASVDDGIAAITDGATGKLFLHLVEAI